MYMRDLQKILGGDAVGEVNQPLTGVGTIRSATSTQITFLANQTIPLRFVVFPGPARSFSATQTGI
jgi:hypothetical protein